MPLRSVCYFAALFVVPLVASQENWKPIAVASTHLAVTNDSIYLMATPNPGAAVPYGLELMQWTNGTIRTTPLLQSTGQDIYHGIGIGQSLNGDLYIACAHNIRTAGPSTVYEIYRVNVDNQLGTLLWKSQAIMPIKFVVSPQGYICILGVTTSSYVRTQPYLSNPSLLLHIVDNRGTLIKSLLPVSLSRPSDALSLALNGIISARSNGNFVVTFNPNMSMKFHADNLISKNVIEYTSSGTIWKSHEFSGIPEGAVVQSAVFDERENLVAQFSVWKEIKGAIHPAGGLLGVADQIGPAFAWKEGVLVKEFKDTSSQTIISRLTSHEILMGILGDGTFLLFCPLQIAQPAMLKFKRF